MEYRLSIMRCVSYRKLFCFIVGSTDRASSQQLQMWFSENFFAPKFCRVVCHPRPYLFVSATVEQIWREKMSENHIPFSFSQSGSRKNNRKAFEGASIEPTIYQLYLYSVSKIDLFAFRM